MRIDLHCHTDNTVKGDIKRYVNPTKFKEIVEEYNIKIVAITNHNKFLTNRYYKLRDTVKETTLVWPGIELTVDAGNGERHMIIIASPNYIEEFDYKLNSLLNYQNPNLVNIKLKELKGLFNPLKVIYIVHYHDKAKKFNDNEIQLLKDTLSDDDLVFLEPTNLTSMGIFLDHNMRSIIGSDVIDWDKYPIHKLPDLRLKVDNFESFRLLATKDKRTVDKLLFEEENYKVELNNKFWEHKFLFYNDINIIFGNKGTGKSILAEEIFKFLNVNSTEKIKYFNSEQTSLNYDETIKVQFTGNEYIKFSMSDLSDEIQYIKKWEQSNPTDIKKYLNWGENTVSNKIKKEFSFVDMTLSETIDDTEYENYIDVYKKLKKIEKDYELIELDSKIKKSTKEKLEDAYLDVLIELEDLIDSMFLNIYSNKLLVKTINIMKQLLLATKQMISKPNTVGFIQYYNDRIKVYDKIKKLEQLFEKKNIFEFSKLGEIVYKGEIFIKKGIIINPKGISDIKYINKKFGKTKALTIIKEIDLLDTLIFDNSFVDEIKKLVTLFNEYEIKDVNDLIGRKNETVFEDHTTIYDPSKGEKHMLALNNVILEEFDIFILDEPTVGLGHEYVCNKILPQLKNLVKQGKSYIIVTHDANLGVRSLPYQSIYMEYHEDRNFYVYKGNPFENKLYEINNRKDSLNWNEVVQKVFEGGKNAFIERKNIYER